MQKKNNPSALSKSRQKKKPEENLSNRITIRFTTEEASLITQRAEARGLKISEYSRSAILRRKITDHSPETKDFIRKFTGMANNLNQITRYMYSKDSTPEKMLILLEYFKEEFQKIKTIIYNTNTNDYE
ncbi:MAG: plasmid mobilization relaxosome protein MobC [Muribaculaceae bacterium]|nr:plasmid mobilization relaxosome protein MobC [Muribaculaceae bacterium]